MNYIDVLHMITIKISKVLHLSGVNWNAFNFIRFKGKIDKYECNA